MINTKNLRDIPFQVRNAVVWFAKSFIAVAFMILIPTSFTIVTAVTSCYIGKTPLINMATFCSGAFVASTFSLIWFAWIFKKAEQKRKDKGEINN